MRHGFFLEGTGTSVVGSDLSDFGRSIYPIFDDLRGGREFTIGCNVLRDKALQLTEKLRLQSRPLRFLAHKSIASANKPLPCCLGSR